LLKHAGGEMKKGQLEKGKVLYRKHRPFLVGAEKEASAKTKNIASQEANEGLNRIEP